MSTLDQPTEAQLGVARRHRGVLDALPEPDRGAVVSTDPRKRRELDELVVAGLAMSRAAGPAGASEFRLTNRGLAAALRLLGDDR